MNYSLKTKVQPFSFLTSYWVNQLGNIGRFYRGPTEIVMFGGVFQNCTNVRYLPAKNDRIKISIIEYLEYVCILAFFSV